VDRSCRLGLLIVVEMEVLGGRDEAEQAGRRRGLSMCCNFSVFDILKGISRREKDETQVTWIDDLPLRSHLLSKVPLHHHR
jgi:hypothetical protein